MPSDSQLYLLLTLNEYQRYTFADTHFTSDLPGIYYQTEKTVVLAAAAIRFKLGFITALHSAYMRVTIPF